MAQVLDYSAGFPGALNIVRAGYVGAVRYIGFPDRRKCTTRAEFEDFSRNGLGMALVYEDNADDWRGGFARGRDAGLRARNHANAIGFPKNRPIYMAVDRDVVTPAEFSAVVDYLRGASQTLGGVQLTGVYGEHDVCARAAQAGVAAWFWQCRAWSGTPIRYFNSRHLFQRVGYVYPGGIQCDVNDIRDGVADWGQHNAQEDDMPLTDADIEKIWGAKNGIYEALRNVLVDAAEQNPAGGYADQVRGALRTCLAGLPVAIDDASIASLAAKLVPALNERGGNGLTVDQVKAALTEVLGHTALTVQTP